MADLPLGSISPASVRLGSTEAVAVYLGADQVWAAPAAGPPSLTGTPVAIDWTQAASPSAQNITIPADATAVYLFAAAYSSNDTNTDPTVTLNGVSPDETVRDGNGGSGTRTTVAGFAWFNPPTGSQPFAISWPAAPTYGPVSIVAFVKGGNTTASRDTGAQSTAPDSFDLTTVVDDLVLVFDAQVGGAPALASGWTSHQTQALYGDGARLRSLLATGTTTTVTEAGSSFPATAGFAIPPA